MGQDLSRNIRNENVASNTRGEQKGASTTAPSNEVSKENPHGVGKGAHTSSNSHSTKCTTVTKIVDASSNKVVTDNTLGTSRKLIKHSNQQLQSHVPNSSTDAQSPQAHQDDIAAATSSLFWSSASVNANPIHSTSSDEVQSKFGASPGMFVSYNKSDFRSCYKSIKVLGKGSFGQVILCIDRVTRQQRAVKVIPIGKSSSRSSHGGKSSVDMKALRGEVEMLKQLDHPNIMKLYEYYEDSEFFYIVTELYTGGELFDAILERKRYNEIDAAVIIKQVLSGITYMHKHNVVHRDLKPENLLLESKDPNAAVKIIDFGLSTYLDALKGKRDKLGTVYYIAPEILLGKECTEKCDIWSAGVILYILLSGCPPFGGADERSILSKVKIGKFTFNLPQWTQVSNVAKDLICKMLTFDASKRLSAAEALEHKWIHIMTKEYSKFELPSLESSISNIRQFQGSQKLAKAALLYMGSKLTSLEETKHLSQIFSKIDKNGDGQLDRDELIEGYKELLRLKGEDISSLDEKLVDEEVDNVLKEIDFDNNGFVDYSEFLTVAMDRETLLSKERLVRAFKDFDVDGSGRISTQELAKIFGYGAGEIDKTTWEELLKEVDQNKDGEIDFEEFKSMLMKLCESTDQPRKLKFR